MNRDGDFDTGPAPSTNGDAIAQLLSALFDEVRALRISIESPREISPLLTREQLASLLQLDERSVRRLELQGDLPAALQFGAAKRWRRADIDKWISERAGVYT